MKKLKYHEIILKLLENEPTRYFQSWEVSRVNTPWGFIGPSGDRIARDMAISGIIDRDGRENGKFYVKFRAKPISSSHGMVTKQLN